MRRRWRRRWSCVRVGWAGNGARRGGLGIAGFRARWVGLTGTGVGYGIGAGEEKRRRLTRVAGAFVGLLEAVAKKPESQDKTKNNQYCHYEDEDLCCFAHITHFLIITHSLFCFLFFVFVFVLGFFLIMGCLKVLS